MKYMGKITIGTSHISLLEYLPDVYFLVWYRLAKEQQFIDAK